MAVQPAVYPVSYNVDEPPRLSRWLWLFKGLLLIPHMFVLFFVSIVAWVAIFIAWIAILVTGKHPRGLWNFILGFNRWSMRINVYMMHMTDRYPPFSMSEEPGYPMHLEATYSERASRLTTFFRYLLALPHLIIVGALAYVLWALWIVNVVIVIFTGKPNTEIFKFMAGIIRWQARANLYLQLITDRYPPFSLE